MIAIHKTFLLYFLLCFLFTYLSFLSPFLRIFLDYFFLISPLVFSNLVCSFFSLSSPSISSAPFYSLPFGSSPTSRFHSILMHLFFLPFFHFHLLPHFFCDTLLRLLLFLLHFNSRFLLLPLRSPRLCATYLSIHSHAISVIISTSAT